MKKKIKRVLLLALLTGILAAACGGGSSSADSPIIGSWKTSNGGIYKFYDDNTFTATGKGQDGPWGEKGTWRMNDAKTLILTITHRGGYEILDDLPKLEDPWVFTNTLEFESDTEWVWYNEGRSLNFSMYQEPEPPSKVSAESSGGGSTSKQRVQVDCYWCNGTGKWDGYNENTRSPDGLCSFCKGTGKEWKYL